MRQLRQTSASDTRLLVADTEGQGRAGSLLTAYVYANNPHLSFQEAYDFVRSRRPIYCHKGLWEDLANIYPREWKKIFLY